MRCPQCQFENREDVRFCEECGARLEQACPACGSTIPPGRKFCGNCGQALTPAAPPATPAPPASKYASPQAYTPKHLAQKILTSKQTIEGERKNVTVMFADVSGFTAMSERLDPEEVHALMDRAFEVILDVVHRYEGTINQFLGDGVMALFGAPIAHEDHPHRALRAALAIQEGLQPLRDDVRRDHEVEFRVRIGINTGLVVVGAIGTDLRMDYTAVGDTTNLAARLLSLAQPGQIVVSRRTQHLREGFFVFEDLGEFQVKGKTEPVRAYALLREIRGRTRLEVSMERGLTPRIGRERELARLMESYRRAADGGGAIVLIAGDPGIGKSRLLYEFSRTLDGSGVLELEARCLSHTHSMPYYPISGLVRRYLGVSDGMSAEEIRARVTERLRSLDLDGEETRGLLAHFLGISASAEFLSRLGPQLKERTFRVLREVFLRVSETVPVVLTVENVHWIDASSGELLGDLASAIPGHRILVLLSARRGVSASWLKAPLVETIALDGLEAEQVCAMVSTLLGVKRVSSKLLTVLLEKGEGNPLYVEEILRQLRETHGIVVEDGEAGLRGDGVTVPATIHDIIAARIDRLAEPVKHTLQVAAVVGRQFALPLLSRVVATNGALQDHLGDLQTHDFIFLNTEEPERVYTFKHALIQDVAYTSLLERRRAVYHAAVGLGIEELYAGRTEEMVELLAFHFGRSGEAEKAVDYTILAAEKAQRRWANTEALAYFEDALKRLATMPDSQPNRWRRIDAVVKQAEVKFALGRHADHIQALEGIRDIVEEVADPPRRAAWYYWTGFLHSLTGARPEIPIAYCREASAIAEAEGLEEVRALAHCCLSHVYAYAGRLREAKEVGERALSIFEARGNVWWACRTLWGLSLTAIPLGLWARSLEYCRRALAHGQEVNDKRLKVVGWWRRGWTHIQQGDAEVGLRCCAEAMALSPSPYDAAMTKAANAYGLVKVGRFEEGIVALREVVEWFEESRLPFTRSWYAIWLADSYLRGGDPRRARRLAEEVLVMSREVGYRYFEGMAERLLGASLTDDDSGAAADHLDAACQILDEVGARNEVAKTLVNQGQLRQRAGDASGARERLKRALAIFEELGTLDEPPRVRAALATLEDNVPA